MQDTDQNLTWKQLDILSYTFNNYTPEEIEELYQEFLETQNNKPKE